VQLFKKFPAFYGTRRSIIVFTRTLHWSLSWARSIQSILSNPISQGSILILYSYLRVGVPSCLFPSGFSADILYAFFLPHSCYIPYSSHPPWLDQVRFICIIFVNVWHILWQFWLTIKSVYYKTFQINAQTPIISLLFWKREDARTSEAAVAEQTVYVYTWRLCKCSHSR
jgi:hypothetical protein